MIKFLVLWAVGMAWHLFRIATFRPDFTRLSDTKATVLSFGLVYGLAGWMRWAVVGDTQPLTVGFNLVVHAVLLMLLFERSDRSSGLLAALFGSSAVVDLVDIVALVGFGLDLPKTPVLAVEVLLSAVCVVRFFNSPMPVQMRGYGRHKVVAK